MTTIPASTLTTSVVQIADENVLQVAYERAKNGWSWSEDDARDLAKNAKLLREEKEELKGRPLNECWDVNPTVSLYIVLFLNKNGCRRGRSLGQACTRPKQIYRKNSDQQQDSNARVEVDTIIIYATSAIEILQRESVQN